MTYTATDEVHWTPAQAVTWVTGQVDAPSQDWTNLCLALCSNAYGFGGSGVSSAAAYWQGSHHTHPGDLTPPVGAHPCWSGGSSGYGHIATVVDDGGGSASRVLIASNDIYRRGRVDICPLSVITASWGQRYSGWADPCYWAGWGTNPDPAPYAPMPAPAHTEVDLIYFTTADGRGWITDGLRKRLVANTTERDHFLACGVPNAGGWSDNYANQLPTDTGVVQAVDRIDANTAP
jgi:hypothetical protein